MADRNTGKFCCNSGMAQPNGILGYSRNYRLVRTPLQDFLGFEYCHHVDGLDE